MKANEVRLSLTDEQVIHLLTKLGATNYIETPSAVIFPTLCHNINIEEDIDNEYVDRIIGGYDSFR